MKCFNGRRWMIWGLLLVLLAGCSLPGGVGQPTATRTAAATATHVVPPTATPRPERVILLAPAGSDPSLTQAVQALLADTARKQNFKLDSVQTLQAGEITPETKLVVILAIVPNLTDLLASAPKTQFVVVSPAELGAGANLSVVRLSQENRGFGAGFMAAVAAPDFRAAALVPAEEPQGTVLEDSFRSGAAYFCGVCNSVGQPVKHFPLVRRVPSGSDPGALQPVLDEMKALAVNTIYVAGALATPQVLQALASQNYNLLGDSAPPQEVRQRWIGELNYDAVGAIQALLPDLLSGKGGKVVNPPLTIADTDSGLLSPGKQQYVENALKTLQAGMVYPFQVPGQ